MNALNLSSSEILNIKRYDLIFNGTEQENKKLYRQLLKKWHPDHSKSNTEDVFVYIMNLFSKSTLASNNIVNVNGVNINSTYSEATSLYTIHYDAVSSSFYVSFNNVAEKLSKNYLSNARAIKELLDSHHLKSRYDELLSLKLFEKEGLFKISIPKKYIPLKPLIDFIIDYKDYKISAYIISRLWDQAMMYSNAGLNCIGADPNFIFVDTETHKILDLSALFFSVKKGENMIALTSYQASSVIKIDIAKKIASENSVASLIVNLGYNLAGDVNKVSNINLLDKDTICEDMIKTLSSFDIYSNLIDLYKKWQTESVKSIFKERSFYKKQILFNDLMPYIK